jgi:hypothetical protein
MAPQGTPEAQPPTSKRLREIHGRGSHEKWLKKGGTWNTEIEEERI